MKKKKNCVRARDKVLEEPCNSQLLCSETNKIIKNKKNTNWFPDLPF